MSEQRIAITRTFINGVLAEPGQTVTVPDDMPSKKKDREGKDIDAMPNLAKPGDLAQRPPYVAAPIGPTGPNPSGPQQIPHDAVQVGSGYVIPGNADTKATQIVGEGAATKPEPTKGSAKAKK